VEPDAETVFRFDDSVVQHVIHPGHGYSNGVYGTDLQKPPLPGSTMR
jgi:hypothetical protein